VPRFAAPLALVLLVAALGGCGKKDEADPIFEHRLAFPVSRILISPKEGRSMTAARVKADALMESIRNGEPFATVARVNSDDEASRSSGGFLGFTDVRSDDGFTGAVQAIPPGGTVGPIQTQGGFQIIHRHTYEEGRRLERETRVVVLGFILPSREASQPVDRSMDETRRLAEEALEKVRSGTSLADAARVYAPEPPKRPDALLGVFGRTPETAWLFDAVKDLPEGALVPHPVPGQGVFAVIARGRFFRCIARHLIVAHMHSKPDGAFPGVQRTREEALARAKQAMAEAHSDGSNWSALLTKYSDEVQGIPLQGTLGCVATGSLAADLESVILDTPPGHVATRLAESPAGFHLIWRVD
jgi:hypothetical protein